jgi:Na+/H+-dicarboxylate symporter
VLGLAVFSLVFGCCLSLLRDSCATLVAITADIEAVVISITRIVFWFVADDEFVC